MRTPRPWTAALATLLLAGAALAATLTRDEALATLSDGDPATRLAAVERLAEIGEMADADPVLQRLVDRDPRVRLSAQGAVWQIWGRSGEPAIDALFAQGVQQMAAGALDDALATFDQIVQRQPAFAEGWNKRATLRFLRGDLEASLRDCDEVFRRNPRHFGALAGAGQIHLQRGDLPRALDFFRRAVEVNPNLDGPARMIPLLERHLREDRNRI
jgi:tetratricopeptide (TPR) repeat protein